MAFRAIGLIIYLEGWFIGAEDPLDNVRNHRRQSSCDRHHTLRKRLSKF